MSRTVEHRVEMARIARERTAAGKPVWDRKLKLGPIFHDESLTFAELRDTVVRKLRASTWFKSYDEYDDLPQFTEELGDTEDRASFNDVLDEIYDIADADRVWIETT
jgi:hypothetical protein